MGRGKSEEERGKRKEEREKMNQERVKMQEARGKGQQSEAKPGGQAEATEVAGGPSQGWAGLRGQAP